MFDKTIFFKFVVVGEEFELAQSWIQSGIYDDYIRENYPLFRSINIKVEVLCRLGKRDLQVEVDWNKRNRFLHGRFSLTAKNQYVYDGTRFGDADRVRRYLIHTLTPIGE